MNYTGGFAETVASEIARIRAAERAVRPFVGDVSAGTPEQIYKLALDAEGIPTRDVPPVAYRAMVGLLPGVVAARAGRPRQIAMDAAQRTAYETRFPNASRLERR